VPDQLKGLLGNAGGRAGPGDTAARTAQATSVPPAKQPPAEQACPACGEPMLARWGATCGKCRPPLSAPRTLVMRASDVVLPSRGLALGWLVVVRCPDDKQIGRLIELTEPAVVLTRRLPTPPSSAPDRIELADEHMSTAHATVHAPERSDDERGAFTVTDREDPGPSANGTFVNSHKLAPGEVVRLCDGDVVRLGTTEMVFKSLWLPPRP
jgi:hypothetical protein